MFNKLIRLKRIIDELNKEHKPISISTLRNRVNTKIKTAVCRSTYEKDIEILKIDFDIKFISSLRGILLESKIDFTEKLNNILK